MNATLQPHESPSPRTWTPPLSVFLCAVLLFALVFALFSPSIRYGFVDFDDPAYIIANRMIHPGLAPASVKEAFCSFYSYAAMYMPLLWVSYMADISLFGASPSNPLPFHAVNVALHAANAVLFFLLLLRLLRISSAGSPTRTGGTRSLSVIPLPALLAAFSLAILWAVHPLRVESVAWIAERKDVLSLFFAFLSLLAYLRAAVSASPGGPEPAFTAPHRLDRAVFSVLSFLFFAAALLSKPALVPFPLFLVAVDCLVLRRPASLRLLFAKTHWFLLSAAASAATLYGHRNACSQLPLATRLFRLPANLAHCLQTVVWPRHLTLLAPDPPYSAVAVLADALLLALLVFLAFRLRRTAPLFSLGISGFFLFLLPVSGLSTIPNNAVADRFSYVPALGLSIALLGLLPVVFPVRHRTFRLLPPACLLLAAAAFSPVSVRLLPNWRDGDALYARVRRFSPGQPFVALHDIRKAIVDSGDFPAALAIARRTLDSVPDCLQVIVPIASCLANTEGPLPAIGFLEAHRPPPGHFLGEWAWYMAQLSLRTGRPGDALAQADLADAWLPPQDNLHANIQLLREAASAPDDPAAALPHYLSQWATHERADALGYFRRLLAAHPDRPDFFSNVAWILSTASWSPAPPSEALDFALRALALAPDPPPPGLLDTVAAAQANASDFSAAVATQERAIALLPPFSPSRPAYLARLELYRASLPFRESL